MDCKSLRDKFYEGEEELLRRHVSECSECREWLRREEKLSALMAEVHADSSAKAEKLAGRLIRPDKRLVGRILPWVLLPVAAAATVVLAVGILLHEQSAGKPQLTASRVVVIEGKVTDDSAPPQYIEVDGKQYPVERVSATEGIWRVEVTLESKRRDLVLSAVDASGNRSNMNIHIQR